jgi:hypothetical protein
MATNLGLLYQCPCIVMCIIYGFDALELFSNYGGTKRLFVVFGCHIPGLHLRISLRIEHKTW